MSSVKLAIPYAVSILSFAIRNKQEVCKFLNQNLSSAKDLNLQTTLSPQTVIISVNMLV